jgi:virulence-associated protein VagC
MRGSRYAQPSKTETGAAAMPAQAVKLLTNGRSQVVRLPQGCRFDDNVKDVYVSRDQLTGDIRISTRPNDWDGLFAQINAAHFNISCTEEAANLGLTDANMYGHPNR